jgi:hypothetical protein
LILEKGSQKSWNLEFKNIGIFPMSMAKTKKPQISLKLYLVAGTGLEPVFATADMSPLDYNLKIRLLVNSFPVVDFK